MDRALLIVAAALALMWLVQACGGGKRIPGEQARALVADGATLLDVRTPAEFAGGHLDGAVNIPVAELGQRLEEVPQDKPVVVYCRSGQRSRVAANQLRSAGRDVYDVGGMARY